MEKDFMKFIKIFVAFCGPILLIFVVCFVFYTWAQYSVSYGVPTVIVNNTEFVLGSGTEIKDLPLGFEYAGRISRLRGSTSDLSRDFDGYKCRIGDEVYSNPEIPYKVLLFDRYKERYLAYTTDELQQLIIRVDGRLYIKKLEWFNYYDRERTASLPTDTLEILPEGCVKIGNVSSVISDSLPESDLQICTVQGLFKGYEVYLSDDKTTVYLCSQSTQNQTISKFVLQKMR